MRKNSHYYHGGQSLEIYFKLDKPSGVSIRKIKDKSLIKKILNAFKEFHRDGASHVYTTYRITDSDISKSTVDKTMDDGKAEVILSLLPQGVVYFAKIKWIKWDEQEHK